MEKEKIEIVLEEILEELKVIKDAVLEEKQQTWQLQERLVVFEKKLSEIKLIAPAPDTKQMQTIINTSLLKIQQIIAEQPKSVIYERRFLLFPEHYARDYYRVIFRIIMWLTVVCTGAYLFSLAKTALENNKEVRLRQLESESYKSAWEYLYDQENKQGKQKMDKAWNNGNK